MCHAHQLDAARIVGTKAVSTTTMAGSPARLRHITSSNTPSGNVRAARPIVRVEPLRTRVANQPRAMAATVPAHTAVRNHDTTGRESVLASNVKIRTMSAMTLAMRPGTTARRPRTFRSRAAWLMDLRTFLFPSTTTVTRAPRQGMF
jgi:hypothetical protein